VIVLTIVRRVTGVAVARPIPWRRAFAIARNFCVRARGRQWTATLAPMSHAPPPSTPVLDPPVPDGPVLGRSVADALVADGAVAARAVAARAVVDRAVADRAVADRAVADRAVADRALPDRYADAVRARRAELRGARELLLGGHRAELRSCLAACRLAAAAELSVAMAGLGRELRRHADTADAAGRAALPGLADAAVRRHAAGVGDRWAGAVGPGLRRIAAQRSVPWPGPGGRDPMSVLAGPVEVAVPVPEAPPGIGRVLLAGAIGGAWRLALLPAAVLPAVGLPVLAGWSAVPLALGLGLALLVVAARAQRVAADRARLRRWAVEVVAAMRGALETELSRRLIELDRVAGAELDEAVARRRAAVDAELQELAFEPEEGDRARG
jgi:hypothetical protein